MRKRKIAIFTGTRAEYGLLHWIIKGLNDANDVDVMLMVGGMHLSPEFGNTINEIKRDGFKISKMGLKVEGVSIANEQEMLGIKTPETLAAIREIVDGQK